MFTHVMVGANNLEKARKFYDATLSALGLTPSDPKMQMPLLMYRNDKGAFLVKTPLDGKSATHANGGTIGFSAPNRKAVDEFHKAALANGGKCEGPPGPREVGPNAYGAYVRDPDGNKLCAYSYTPA